VFRYSSASVGGGRCLIMSIFPPIGLIGSANAIEGFEFRWEGVNRGDGGALPEASYPNESEV
jgi:hypothetical protein